MIWQNIHWNELPRAVEVKATTQERAIDEIISEGGTRDMKTSQATAALDIADERRHLRRGSGVTKRAGISIHHHRVIVRERGITEVIQARRESHRNPAGIQRSSQHGMQATRAVMGILLIAEKENLGGGSSLGKIMDRNDISIQRQRKSQRGPEARSN